MTLPLFPPGADPGSSFADLVRRSEPGPPLRHELAVVPARAPYNPPSAPYSPGGVPGVPGALQGVGVPHATTIVALRYSGGVVMAGDRRATEGHVIAHRTIEKVFPADRYSAIAIAGAAGPAIDMVRLFQTQLEHYEKVEGTALSLEGKANQLAQMVRANLPFAMEGLVVVPLFAGYDLRRKTGRIFSFDAAGGRYEELEFHATGSGGRDAKNTVKLGYDPAAGEADAVQLAVKALFEAADEDTATGGPDPLRGIYPIVAVVDAAGYRRLAEDVVAASFESVLAASPRSPAGWESGRSGGGEDA